MRIHKKKFISTCAIFLYLMFKMAYANEAGAIVISVKPTSTSDFAQIVENVLLWMLSVAGFLAMLTFIVGGIMYMTSSGDEQKVGNAKKIIKWTIIGLTLILASYAIIVVIDVIFAR